jgi:hypothetical protein
MHVLKSVGVMSVAKLMGVIYGCTGMLGAPIFLMAAFIGPAAGRQKQPLRRFPGVGLTIMAPIL